MDEAELRVIELEYKQASFLLQRGFLLLFDFIKWVAYANIFLMALVVGLRLGLSRNFNLLVWAGALFGAAGSLSALLIHTRVMIYLRRLLERASELEGQFGGQIFTRIQEIGNEERNAVVQTYPVSLLIYPAFALGWALLLYAALTG